MKSSNIYISYAIRILKILFVSYLLTGIFLALLAGILYKFQLEEGKVQIGIILTYIFSCFVGGFLAGKTMRNRKFLWGLCLGILYFAVMLLISLAVNQGLQEQGSGFVTSFLLCMGGGMLGGMLS